jgi:serine/threonine-protein kinase HipA
MNTDVLVYADWEGLSAPVQVGELHSQSARQKEVFSFAYDKEWLSQRNPRLIDPKLQLFSGLQYSDDSPNFRVFLDSCPDRWGRLLMTRREAARAKAEGRAIKHLREVDFLLGVHDLHRMGALRFKLSVEGDFLDNDMHHAAPPITSLRELENAVRHFEQDDDISDEYLHWLSLLIAPGSSLGGARPKASVRDEKHHLWIAKFPSRYDDYDIGAWEYIVYQLAVEAGINMPACRLEQYNSHHHTFLTKRFDRTEAGRRLHFCSAMTLLGCNDGDDGKSYLELAQFLVDNGTRTSDDLEQLFTRIVFSIAISNTDDHLRNHGFIQTDQGWILSPAYDINPVALSSGLHLNINEASNQLSMSLALETAVFYRLGKQQAHGIVKNVESIVSTWREKASAVGISRQEQSRMEPAFSVKT